MANIGFGELLVIAFIALLVFGPERLPELARQTGKALSKFRREASRSVEELKRAADIDELDRELREVRGELRRVTREIGDVAIDRRSRGVATSSGAADGGGAAPSDPEAT